MNQTELNDFIHFFDQKDYVKNLWKNEWVVVYKLKRTKTEEGYKDNICFYSCLVNEKRKQDHKKYTWISGLDSGKLGNILTYKVPLKLIDKIKNFLFSKLLSKIYIHNYLWNSEQLEKRNTKIFKIKNYIFKIFQRLGACQFKTIKEYQRFPETGIENLIHVRFFNHYPSYIEISQKFCHYFNLYEDRKNNLFLSSDESGNPIEVVKISNDSDEMQEVRIKKKYLNEFLYVKNMWLCVQFDHLRWIAQILKNQINEDCTKGDCIYSLHSGRAGYEDEKTFIRFLGVKFIKYKEVKYLWNESKPYYEEFSFIDSNGEEKLFTCEENKLANFYEKNPDAPRYLTPIAFRKDVLRKYYDDSSKYSVRDGSLTCENCWSMPIDVQDNRVTVYLGDLSRLPYREQKYWRSFNTIEKARMSQKAWERDMECKWDVPTDQPDFLFRDAYSEFNENWHRKYGWYFFTPLSSDDKHCFNSLRVPLSEEQSEFDVQILNLVKAFLEPINIKKIKEVFPASYKKEDKTIDVLEKWFLSKNIQLNDMFKFLRKLQRLRSKGSAHIKGSEYNKTLDFFKNFKEIKTPDSKKEIFYAILTRCIRTINTLKKYFLNEQ